MLKVRKEDIFVNCWKVSGFPMTHRKFSSFSPWWLSSLSKLIQLKTWRASNLSSRSRWTPTISRPKVILKDQNRDTVDGDEDMEAMEDTVKSLSWCDEQEVNFPLLTTGGGWRRSGWGGGYGGYGGYRGKKTEDFQLFPWKLFFFLDKRLQPRIWWIRRIWRIPWRILRLSLLYTHSHLPLQKLFIHLW